jgi:hypothetical protein
VLAAELPGVATVSGVGPQGILAFYSKLRQRMDKPGSSTLGGHAADQSIPQMAV